MTRRRIVLELGETTTETHCEDCRACSVLADLSRAYPKEE